MSGHAAGHPHGNRPPKTVPARTRRVAQYWPPVPAGPTPSCRNPPQVLGRGWGQLFVRAKAEAARSSFRERSAGYESRSPDSFHGDCQVPLMIEGGGHSSPIPTTGGRGGKCRTGSRAGVLRDSWPAGGCEARRSRRPGPMIVKTVNFLSRKRLRRNRARIVGESDRKPESAQSRASASE